MFVITKMNMVLMPWDTCVQEKGVPAIETKKYHFYLLINHGLSPQTCNTRTTLSCNRNAIGPFEIGKQPTNTSSYRANMR